MLQGPVPRPRTRQHRSRGRGAGQMEGVNLVSGCVYTWWAVSICASLRSTVTVCILLLRRHVFLYFCTCTCADPSLCTSVPASTFCCMRARDTKLLTNDEFPARQKWLLEASAVTLLTCYLWKLMQLIRMMQMRQVGVKDVLNNEYVHLFVWRKHLHERSQHGRVSGSFVCAWEVYTCSPVGSAAGVSVDTCR